MCSSMLDVRVWFGWNVTMTLAYVNLVLVVVSIYPARLSSPQMSV